jgi:hypothetical protein
LLGLAGQKDPGQEDNQDQDYEGPDDLIDVPEFEWLRHKILTL